VRVPGEDAQAGAQPLGLVRRIPGRLQGLELRDRGPDPKP